MKCVRLAYLFLGFIYGFGAFAAEPVDEINLENDPCNLLIEKLNKNLEDSVFFDWNYCILHGDPWGEPFETCRENLLYREIQDSRGPQDTLSPVAMMLILKEKPEQIKNTSMLLLKYPKLPKAIAKKLSSQREINDYMDTQGGVFPQLKNFLKEKIILKQDFNTMVILPDGHTTLFVYRVADDGNKFFILDSVGKLMRFKASLCETINAAFKEAECAENSYVMFGSYLRQADFHSCPLFVMKDLIYVAKYPQVLVAIVRSIKGGNLCSVAQAENDKDWANVFKQIPVHMLKFSQIFTVDLDQERREERFENLSGPTMGEYLKTLDKVGPISNPKVGNYWQSMKKSTELMTQYFEEATTAMDSLDDKAFRDLWSQYYVDLYRDDQCANCYKLPPNEQQKYNLCSKCKEVRYCSRDCQVSHWNKGGHKGTCAAREAKK